MSVNIYDSSTETLHRVDLPDAEDVSYDNTSSELTATDVQAAIDEIDGNVDSLGQALTTVENEISDTVNILGAKNLLPVTLTSGTKNGITYTVASDGSITLTGTASADTFLILTDVGNFPTTGNYKLNGSPSDSKNTNHWIWLGTNPGGNGANYNGNGIRSMGANDSIGFDIANLKRGDGSAIDVSANLVLYLTIKSGCQPSGAVYKPMLRPSEIVDKTFVPYAKTNRKLTEENQALTNQIEGLSNLKNKKILIIGDSLSDEALYPNCWVKNFRQLCANIGADVTNYSLQGRTIGRYSGATNYLMNVLSGIPSGSYDKIIVFLGTNDWINQVLLGSLNITSDDSVIQNMKLFSNWVRLNQPAAEVTFITPLKAKIASDMRHKLLQFYVMAITSTAKWFGFQVIDAHSNAPVLSSDNISTWTRDGIHLTDAYSPFLAQYIFNQIISRNSDTMNSGIVTRLAIGDVGGASNRVFALINSDGRISYMINNFTLSGSGNIKLADLPEEVQTESTAYGIGSCSISGSVTPILLLSTGIALYAYLETSVTNAVVAGALSSELVIYVTKTSTSY